MSRKPLYTVQVFSQSQSRWLTAYESSMAACVRLVEGLRTDWVIFRYHNEEPIAEHAYNDVLGYSRFPIVTRSYSEARRKIARLNDAWPMYRALTDGYHTVRTLAA